MNKKFKYIYEFVILVLTLFVCFFSGCTQKNLDEPTIGTEPTIPEETQQPTNDTDLENKPDLTPDIPPTIITTEEPVETETPVYNENDMSQDFPYIQSVVGDDYIVYSNDDKNPYNVDLDKLGSDIRAIFYIPDFNSKVDIYEDINKDDFYNNYEIANSYEDSYYRTKHNLMSGDITPQEYLPVRNGILQDDIYVRCTTATYLLSIDGEFIGYIPNLANTSRIIFYGGAYTSLNDVAAYLYAFGEVPVNSNYNKNKGKNLSVSTWGEYGRVNYDIFSGDTSKYPYEPLLPSIRVLRFRETDFGTLGGYESYNSITGTRYIQKIYNNGKSISRGAARFVFTDFTSVSSVDDRYVFYTYNHYNDFEEYLNYDNGWGKRFGNTTAGNEYCGSTKDYNLSNKYPVTQYEQTVLMRLDLIIEFLNQ